MAFTAEKLEALRRQFGASDGGEMVTPEYRRIADKIFSEGGRRQAPYAGLPTLLDASALRHPCKRTRCPICRSPSMACRWILP